MPLGGLTPEAFLCALRTFHRVFPRITIWYLNNEPTHYISHQRNHGAATFRHTPA
jgi:hypothetical protein